MSLDHDTGAMSGTVLQGRFAGMRLDELRRADLLALLRECRTADEEGARLVEAWLDRTDPDWRDDLHGEHARAGASPPQRGGADITIDEAYAIGAAARRRRRGDKGSAPPADETVASRPRRHRLFRRQAQPRPRRAA